MLKPRLSSPTKFRDLARKDAVMDHKKMENVYVMVDSNRFQAEIDRFKAENDRVKAEHVSIKAENERLKTDNGSLKTANVSLKSINTNLNDKVTSLTIENASLKATELAKDYQTLRDRMIEVELHNRDLTNKHKALEAQIKTATTEKDRMAALKSENA